MSPTDEREGKQARLLIDAVGAVQGRSEALPDHITRAEQLVDPADRATLRTLVDRGHGEATVVPALAGWPPHASVRVEPMRGPAPRWLLSMTAEIDQRLQLEEMVSVVAHEVKNPLAGISGALEVVLHRADEASSEAGILSAAHERVRSLDRTLEDLLLLTRPLALERARVDLVRLAKDSLHEAARALDVEPPELGAHLERCTASSDPKLVDTAFRYLFDHAMREDPSGCRARIDEVPSGFLLAIDYRGGDLERDIEGRIFDPRYLTRSRRTGLSLPVAARILRAHGGDLRLEIGTERVTLCATLPEQQGSGPS